MSVEELNGLFQQRLSRKNERVRQEVVAGYTRWHNRVRSLEPIFKLAFLEGLAEKIKANRAFRTVREDVEAEIDRVKIELGEQDRPELKPDRLDRNIDDFTPDNYTPGEEWKVGGDMTQPEKVIMDADDNAGIFKPEFDISRKYFFKGTRAEYSGISLKDVNQTGRSVAAYRIDQLLGANIIPATFKAKKGNTDGSVMKFIEAAKPMRFFQNRQLVSHDEPGHRREISNLYLMDVITGQVDRHGQNIQIHDGKVGGIDNDAAFGKNVSFNSTDGSVFFPLPINPASKGEHQWKWEYARKLTRKIMDSLDHSEG